MTTLSLSLPRRLLAAAALAALLTGCSFIPAYERPDAPVASAWPENGLGIETAEATAPLAAWSQFITDAQLRELIGLALANNRDLRVATLSIEQARAQYQLTGAGPLPVVNAGVTGSRQSTNDGDTISSAYTGGLLVSAWELDFFGRLASLTEVARADLLSTAYAREAVQTSLIANVATAWLNLQTANALLDLTEQTLKTREDSQRLTQLRFDSGVVSALDLSQAQSLTASARATLAEQKRQLAQARNALTLLVGQEIEPRLLTAGDVPLGVFEDVPAGLPSDLLLRRPDIQSAEWSLRSANANIGAARAAFFPSISLTASVGSASSHLSDLFRSGSFGWTLAPQALLPIFDGGRNRANLRGAEVAREVAVAQYEKAIQTAFSEVADGLAGRATLADQLTAQEELVKAESQRYELSDLRYKSGVSSFLDMLDAQRSLFTAQQAVLQSRAALLANRITMYRVLGGGWDAGAVELAESAAPAAAGATP
ncbi:efflux transporter outer membrane subunit [Corticibacter populi]|uniref:Efflux transporter outer membrane subunit n=2 Tax=Corticibacter populi TaxID=1550736 RepID=A0A3M6QTY3_9BURK|nr:efflux transporter outer membrane subunit [Corticibacter populi]